MTRIIHFTILLVFASYMAQSQSGTAQQSAPDPGLVPLAAPYTISTAPHFAVLVEFPRGDSIRRIALGDSNYFLAEADKDDPHYEIVKQIRTSGSKANPPIKTNRLVYMASGRVVNIMLKAGKLADTAYSVDYPVPQRATGYTGERSASCFGKREARDCTDRTRRQNAGRCEAGTEERCWDCGGWAHAALLSD